MLHKSYFYIYLAPLYKCSINYTCISLLNCSQYLPRYVFRYSRIHALCERKFVQLIYNVLIYIISLSFPRNIYSSTEVFDATCILRTPYNESVLTFSFFFSRGNPTTNSRLFPRLRISRAASGIIRFIPLNMTERSASYRGIPRLYYPPFNSFQ